MVSILQQMHQSQAFSESFPDTPEKSDITQIEKNQPTDRWYQNCYLHRENRNNLL